MDFEWVSSFSIVFPDIDSGFVAVIAGVIAMVWGLAFICEEYCVPAITVFCKRNRISDDIAGSIFIGAGLSLPVLFSSYVGLFVSKSAIGVGTVVGGDVFNHLVNLALSIYVAPNRTLPLDKAILTRECIFYLASCVLVIWAAEDDFIAAIVKIVSRERWLKCLSIGWLPSFVLVIWYIIYCVAEAYYDRFALWIQAHLRWCRFKTTSHHDSETEFDGGASPAPLTSPRHNYHIDRPVSCESKSSNDSSGDSLGHEMKSSGGSRHHRLTLSRAVNYSEVAGGEDFVADPELGAIALSPPRQLEGDLGIRDASPAGTICAVPQPMLQHQRPSMLPSVAASEVATATSLSNVEFILFIRSAFYANHDFGCIPSSRKWKLRYFTLDENGMYYRIEGHLPQRGRHVRFINVFDLEEVQEIDKNVLEFTLRLRTNNGRYYFRAPDLVTYDAVMHIFSEFQAEWKKRTESERAAMAIKAIYEVSDGTEALVNPDSECVADDMFTVPSKPLNRAFYYFILVLKYLIFLTVPDVRRPGYERYAVLSMCSSVVWLALLSYVLIVGLTILGNMLGITSAVMGLTVAAWAASYPALWSSIVVARNGFGDMASCNALGSNVFSNFIGLGLPWLTWIIVNGGKPYTALEDDGVVLSMSLLMLLLALFYLLLALNQWTLKEWMIPVLLLGYVLYVGYFVYFSMTL